MNTPDWLTVSNFLLTLVVALVAWIGKGFAKRLDKFEHTFEQKMEKFAVAIDRSDRHEAAISKLQEDVSEVRVELASWGVVKN